MYFTLVLMFSMFFMHPVYLTVSLLCAAAFSIRLSGKSALRLQLKFLLPTVLAVVLINPAFSHAGAVSYTHLTLPTKA